METIKSVCIYCGKEMPKKSLNIFCNKICRNKFLVIDYIDHPINQPNQPNQTNQLNQAIQYNKST
jgi:hypothetical protein